MKRFLCVYLDLAGVKQAKVHLGETSEAVKKKLEKCGFKVLRVSDKTIPPLDSEDED